MLLHLYTYGQIIIYSKFQIAVPTRFNIVAGIAIASVNPLFPSKDEKFEMAWNIKVGADRFASCKTEPNDDGSCTLNGCICRSSYDISLKLY